MVFTKNKYKKGVLNQKISQMMNITTKCNIIALDIFQGQLLEDEDNQLKIYMNKRGPDVCQSLKIQPSSSQDATAVNLDRQSTRDSTAINLGKNLRTEQ